MQPIPPTVSPRPFTLENSETCVSIKATVPGKRGDVQSVVCMFNKKGRENARANADFALRAFNDFEKALKVCEYLRNNAHNIDDSGYGKNPGEEVYHSPELEIVLKEAEEVLFPGGFDPHAPRLPRVDPRYDNRQYAAEAARSVGGPVDGTIIDENHPDLAVTPAKIAAWEKQK